MPARFNHMILICEDAPASAAFYRDVLEGEAAPSWGIFTNITIADGVLLQFASPPAAPTMLHLAFQCTDDHFDRAVALLRRRGLEYWADPHKTQPGETNSDHGGRGVYFTDPSGNLVELLTASYL